MSEATLAKIQKDCQKLEAELAMYENSIPIKEACEKLIATILASPDSFYQGNKEANPWHSGNGGDGGCCTIS